ncbi:SCO7613 C-terminal domain-containing membrane protein [Thalassiella azotivora]
MPDQPTPHQPTPDRRDVHATAPHATAVPPGPAPRPRLADRTRCPSCGAPLAGPVCGSCRVDLRGATAVALWQASLTADRALDERDRLVAALRSERDLAQARGPAPVAARATGPGTLAASPPPPPPPPAPAPTRPARRGLGVQTLLVGLGALLLAVAAVVFLAFSWDLIGLVGRSVVVAVTTAGVLAGAVLARRSGLTATAEAVAAVGAVLVLLDAAAVRATGLAGTGVPVTGYAALSALGCGVVLGSFGVLTRLRTPVSAAAALLPLAPVLGGAQVAVDTSSDRTAASALAAGLLVAALVSPVADGSAQGPAARGSSPGTAFAPERGALRVLAGVATVLALLASLGLALAGAGWHAGAVALGAVLVAVAHGTVRRLTGSGGRTATVAWWATAGGGTAWAAAASSADAVATAWAPLTLVAAATAVVLPLAGLSRALPSRDEDGARRAGPLRPAAAGALGTLLGVSLPALVLTALHAVHGASLAVVPWSTGWWTATGAAAPLPLDDVSAASRAAGLLGVLVTCGATAAAAAVGPFRRLGPVVAATAAGALAVAVPWQPWAPLGAAVAVQLLLAVTAVVVGLRSRRRVVTVLLVTAGCVALGVAVLAAWASQWLSVPVTVVALLALLAARRPVPWLSPLLLSSASAAAMVCAGAVGRWAGLDLADGVVAGAAAGALVVAVGVLPRLTSPERVTLVVTGSLPLLATAAVTTVGVDTEPRPQLLVGLAVAAATLLSTAGSRARSSAVPAAAALPPLGAWWVVVLSWLWSPLPAELAAAGVVLLAAVAATTLGHGRRARDLDDPRRRALEAGATVTAVLLLLALAAGSAADAWPPLLVLTVAAAATAVSPRRRPVRWVALALGTLTWWTRLSVDDITAVEPYTVPTAFALLGLAAWDVHRGRRLLGPAALVATALLVAPTTLSAVTGTPWRPAALLVVATALAAAASRPRPAHGWPADAAVLAAGASLLALAGPVVRALVVAAQPVTLRGDLTAGAAGEVGAGAGWAAWTGDWSVPETWSLPAALVLVPALGALLRGPAVRWPVPAHAPALAVLLVAAVPTLLVVATSPATTATDDVVSAARCLAVLGAAAALAVAARTTAAAAGPLVVAGGAVLVGLVDDVAGPVELLTTVLALTVLVVGVQRWRAGQDTSSWPWLGSGCALLLVPALLASFADAHPVRVGLLALAGAVVVAAGAARRLQAPVVVGAVVLAVHGVVQLGPWVVEVYSGLPRWVGLGLAGLVLLALGARYEQRVRDVSALAVRVRDMR